MARFIVLHKSQSAHCCFGFTVVDTTIVQFEPTEHDPETWYKAMCETFDLAEAEEIADALNYLNGSE